MSKSSRLFRSLYHELGRLRDFVARLGRTSLSNRGPSRLILEGLEDRSVPAAPDLTLTAGGITYTENAAPGAIDTAATLVDAEQNWNTGTLTACITGNATAADRLSILSEGGVSLSGLNVLVGSTSVGTASAMSVTGGTTLNITFNANATDADVQAIVRAIGFDNTSDAPSTLQRTVTLSVTDQQGASDTGTRSVGVSELNDPATAGDDSLASIAEDSGDRIIHFADLLGNDSPGPADESGQALTVASVGNAIGGAVGIVGGNAIFTPAADFFGTASFEYFVRDDGTTNGASDPLTSVAPGLVSFAVTPVADTPSVTNATTTVNTQTTSGLVITPNNLDGASITHFQITGITNGTLFLNDGTTQVNDGDFITAAQGLAGLRFTPTGNLANPATSFFFDVQAAMGESPSLLGGGLTRARILVADNIPPDTTINTFPPALSNSVMAQFTFSGTDNIVPPVLTFEYSLNGSAFTSISGAVSLTLVGFPQGLNTLQVRALDESGNPDPTPASYTWLVDTIGPSVLLSEPSVSITNTGPVSFVVT